MEKPLISIVTPVYGCQECIYELYYRLKETLEKINLSFEIIFVDDNSPDTSWKFISELAKQDMRVKGFRFSRNFGQHRAITAGLEKSKGDWVVVMDCDLQDKPEEIEKLYQAAIQGFDIVLARRIDRQDHLIKKYFSKIFYFLLGYLTGTKQDSSIANFGIYDRKVINAVISMKDSSRYFPAMIKWVGFNQDTINVEHSKRTKGRTTYSFKKLINLGIDVIISFSDKPLRLVVKLGIFISLISIIAAIIELIRYFMGYIKVSGYTSLIISIWLLSGIMIFILGIIGLYLGKTLDKVKDRPVFIIKEQTVNE